MRWTYHENPEPDPFTKRRLMNSPSEYYDTKIPTDGKILKYSYWYVMNESGVQISYRNMFREEANLVYDSEKVAIKYAMVPVYIQESNRSFAFPDNFTPNEDVSIFVRAAYAKCNPLTLIDIEETICTMCSTDPYKLLFPSVLDQDLVLPIKQITPNDITIKKIYALVAK